MKLNYILAFFLIMSQLIFSQKIYYVSKTNNSDFSSIKEINDNMSLFKPGDKILFNRGEVFNDEKLEITQSGSYTNQIEFGAYGNGSRPIIANSNYMPTSWLIIIKASFITISDIEIIGSRWIKAFDNSHYLNIENCYFHHYKKNGALEAEAKYAENEPLLVWNSDYFSLKNSFLYGNYNSSYQDMIVVYRDCQFTLIENNYIDGGSHVSVAIRGAFREADDRNYDNSSPNHTIIRNNHFYNHSHHCLGVNVGSWMTLIEKNYFERSGTGIDSSDYYGREHANDGTIGSAIYNYGSGILRNNIITNSGSDRDNRAIDGLVRYATDGRRSEVFDQAIYNNVFWNNYSEGYKTGLYYHVDYGWADDLRYENISFINNTFGGKNNPTNDDLYIYKANTKKDYLGDYRNNSFSKPNIRYKAGTYTAMSVSNFNSSPPGNIKALGNINVSPNFVSPDNIPEDGDIETALKNFQLQSGSQLIDAGDFLTYTVGSGTNRNKIIVSDAKFFFDGWGVVEGDQIQIGNETVRITDVDYASNILTVDRNISWSNNIGVSLPYSGNKPDIGAVEYTQEGSVVNSNSSELVVFLEGNFNGDEMFPSYISSNSFPVEQPYNVSPWNLSDNSTYTSNSSSIIDWIIIELRTEPTKISYIKPALVDKDGKVLNTNETNISFNNITSGNYYIVIRHRNHLDIMSSEKVYVENGKSIGYDFSDAPTKAYGNNAMTNLGNGVYGMYAGDADKNNMVNNLDFGSVANNIPKRGYYNYDLDMNSIVNVLDYNKINKNILKNSKVPIAN